jgi:hypothetical protein
VRKVSLPGKDLIKRNAIKEILITLRSKNRLDIGWPFFWFGDANE